MKILTFLTDFGLKSGYVSQMKAVASSITDARLIDITHDITPHNILEGAFILRTGVPFFPVGAVHVAVVDPGVGTERKGLVITTKSQILVGPDNGLLLPAARHLGNFIVYEISNEKYMRKNISNTFHGRDIFTPIAAHILEEIPFEEIGIKTNNYVDLNFGQVLVTDKSIIGKVIYIDHFGNIITNISWDKIKGIINYGQKLKILIKKKQYELVLSKSYGLVKKNQILATIGSSNFLEISINQANAAKKLGFKPEDQIKIFF